MLTNPRASIETAAREMLRSLADLPTPPRMRVAEVEGGVACLILVWDASQMMPSVGAERRRVRGGREGCKLDIVEAVRAVGKAVTRKQILKALRLAGKEHGPGTVAKALADLTSTGELVNHRDKKGYRMPGWRQAGTPSLF